MMSLSHQITIEIQQLYYETCSPLTAIRFLLHGLQLKQLFGKNGADRNQTGV